MVAALAQRPALRSAPRPDPYTLRPIARVGRCTCCGAVNVPLVEMTFSYDDGDVVHEVCGCWIP